MARYKYKGAPVFYFGISFLIASFLHGLYDYLLFEHKIVLVLAIFIFAVQVWTIIINNSLNNSKYFSFSQTFQDEKLRFFLAVMLTGILILNYFVNAIQYGKEPAHANYMASCVYGGLLIVFYVSNLSNYDLVRGYWRPIQLRFSPPNNEQLPGNRGLGSVLGLFKYNLISPLNIVNYTITLCPPHYNKVLYGIMDECTGVVKDRICLYTESEKSKKMAIDTDWFLIELENNIDLQHYVDSPHVKSHVLLKLETKSNSLIHDEDIRVYIRLIPNIEMLTHEKPMKHSFEPVGYGLLNCIAAPGYRLNPA